MNAIKIYNLSDIERKELQRILLEIYCDIAEVCKKYNLKMLMGGGSCLGAVRHKGFIPWDDDIDLIMPRTDYNKLLEVFDKELGEKYYLVDLVKTHSGQNLFAKIMKKNTTFIEKNTNANNSPASIFVDIFPLEFLPDNRYIRSIYLFFAKLFTKLIFIIVDYQLTNLQVRYRDVAIYRNIGKVTSVISVYKWNYLYSVFISSCSGNKFCFLPSGGHGVYGELLPVDTYFPLSEGIFEGKKVNLPHRCDKYLKNLYGDYMKLPPLDKRQGNHPIMSFSTSNSEKEKYIKEIDAGK
jgi:lipopolysaccharide cholinephosphotransferase